MTKVLILSEPGDIHAYAVAFALKQKGADAVLWHTTDFPTRSTETVIFDELHDGEVRLAGLELELRAPLFDVVWRRRPSYVLDPVKLHPADRTFADFECNLFRRSLFDVIAPEAFWVNPQNEAVIAGRKLVQHRYARSLGIKTPDTIYTNDPDEIRSFIRRNGGAVVYKPFRAVTWEDNDTYWAPYTSILTEEKLVAPDLLRLTPGIYQALVPKAFEVRATAIGSHILSVKLFSQETKRGRLDWRKSYDELVMQDFRLPHNLTRLCLRLMESLGIVFGCFDFIVTPEGEYVFLEVNEMGQFLFVEHYAGIPLLDAFSEFLIQRRLDFQWNEEKPSISYEAVSAAVLDEMNERARLHVTPPSSAIPEVQ